MTDYTELVKALRCCISKNPPETCVGCTYSKCNNECAVRRMILDASAAIEALLKENKELIEDHPEMVEADGHWEWRKPNGEVLMPKREEVWKDVIGYEGLYQVSDQARVRNNKGKILKQSVKVGKCVYYKYVKLYKDGQYRQGYVHRMMAECFIPNPDNLPIINHKDEDGTNNRLDNLEWCTVEYNSNYGNAKRNMSRGKRRRAKMEVQDESAGSL